jgi:hypothetical protein
MSARKADSAQVLYTADMHALENDEIAENSSDIKIG